MLSDHSSAHLTAGFLFDMVSDGHDAYLALDAAWSKFWSQVPVDSCRSELSAGAVGCHVDRVVRSVGARPFALLLCEAPGALWASPVGTVRAAPSV